jgi:hypothetical protein
MRPETRRFRSPLTSMFLLGLVPSLFAGCGDDPMNAQGQQMASAAGRAVAGLESTSATGWVLSGVDLTAGANRDAIDITARILDDVLGRCVVATAHPAPELGITVGFVDGGCGIPLTPIQFSGSMSLDFRKQPTGSSLAIVFRELTLLDTVLDGSLELSDARDAFSYDARALRVQAQDQDVTLDGRGTMTTEDLHTAMVFDGNGMITAGTTAIAFTASNLHRKIRDCYPHEGTLVLRVTELGVPAEMTLHFDDDTADSGKVKVDWAGEEHEWYLPARGCTDR